MATRLKNCGGGGGGDSQLAEPYRENLLNSTI